MVRERLKQALKLAHELGSIGKKVIEDEVRVRFGETVAESARKTGTAPPTGPATGRRPVAPGVAQTTAAPPSRGESMASSPRADGPSPARTEEASAHTHGHSHSHSHSHSHGHAHGRGNDAASAPSARSGSAAPPASTPLAGSSSGAKRIATVTAPPARLGTPLPTRTGPVRPWIEQTVQGHPVVLFVKGRPGAPACGFSASVLELFEGMGHAYVTVDVLADAEVRDEIKSYSQWPTIPQIFVRGEFLGGADIVKALAASGELKAKLEAAPPAIEV